MLLELLVLKRMHSTFQGRKVLTLDSFNYKIKVILWSFFPNHKNNTYSL